jgi:hypothetical protein
VRRRNVVEAVPWLAAASAGVLPAGTGAVRAAGSHQAVTAAGTVVSLSGTPHLFITDEAGELHWGGDTRALAERHVEWGNRISVGLEQLKAMRRGDPWLSAGLLKDGNPIYLAKWESNWSVPRLQHIQSIRDVELFGINSGNYGRFVIEKGEWERRYGISVGSLQREALAAADTSVVLVNQPLQLEEGGSSSEFRAYWARVSFTLDTVERTLDGSQVWRFTIWNQNDRGHLDVWGCTSGGPSCANQYVVSASGTRHQALAWRGAEVVGGERREIQIVFTGTASSGVYRLYLTSATINYHSTDPTTFGSQHYLTWRPLSVTLP